MGEEGKKEREKKLQFSFFFSQFSPVLAEATLAAVDRNRENRERERTEKRRERPKFFDCIRDMSNLDQVWQLPTKMKDKRGKQKL